MVISRPGITTQHGKHWGVFGVGNGQNEASVETGRITRAGMRIQWPTGDNKKGELDGM